MRVEPLTELQPASSVPADLKVALGENIHTQQRIKTCAIHQFEAHDLLKYEGKRAGIIRI